MDKKECKPDGLMQNVEGKKDPKQGEKKSAGKYAGAAAVGVTVVAAELWNGDVDDEAVVIPEFVSGGAGTDELDVFAEEAIVEDGGNLDSEELTAYLEQKPVDVIEEEVDDEGPILNEESTMAQADGVQQEPELFAIESVDGAAEMESFTISNPAPYMAQMPVKPSDEEVLDEENVPVGGPTVAMTDEVLETSDSFIIESVEGELELDSKILDDSALHLAQVRVEPTAEEVLGEEPIPVAASAIAMADEMLETSELFAIESVEGELDLDSVTLDDSVHHLAQALVEPTVEDVIGEEDVPLFASTMPVDAIDGENAQTVEMDSVFAFNEIDPADKDGENILTFDKVGTMIGEDGQVMATATYFDDGQHLMLVDTDGDQIFDHIASTEGKIYFPVDYNLSVGDVASMVDNNDTYLATTDVDSSSYDTSNDLIIT